MAGCWRPWITGRCCTSAHFTFQAAAVPCDRRPGAPASHYDENNHQVSNDCVVCSKVSFETEQTVPWQPGKMWTMPAHYQMFHMVVGSVAEGCCNPQCQTLKSYQEELELSALESSAGMRSEYTLTRNVSVESLHLYADCIWLPMTTADTHSHKLLMMHITSVPFVIVQYVYLYYVYQINQCDGLEIFKNQFLIPILSKILGEHIHRLTWQHYKKLNMHWLPLKIIQNGEFLCILTPLMCKPFENGCCDWTAKRL